MMHAMRTTLTLDSAIAKQLKEIAHRSGKSFKHVVNETLREGLRRQRRGPARKGYRIRPASLGGVMPGIDLDKALAVADALEDIEIARKMQLRK